MFCDRCTNGLSMDFDPVIFPVPKNYMHVPFQLRIDNLLRRCMHHTLRGKIVTNKKYSTPFFKRIPRQQTQDSKLIQKNACIHIQ